VAPQKLLDNNCESLRIEWKKDAQSLRLDAPREPLIDGTHRGTRDHARGRILKGAPRGQQTSPTALVNVHIRKYVQRASKKVTVHTRGEVTSRKFEEKVCREKLARVRLTKTRTDREGALNGHDRESPARH